MRILSQSILVILFLLVIFSCDNSSGQASSKSNNDEPASSYLLSNEFALETIKQNHHYGFVTAYWRNRIYDSFDRDEYEEYLSIYKYLEKEGLVILEVGYDRAIVPNKIAEIQVTEYGLEAYGGNSRGSMIIGSELPDKILGIIHNEAGNEADVKFSVRYQDSPFLKLSGKRGHEGYSSKKVPYRKAHFVRYDTGWQLETIDDRPVSVYFEIEI